MDDVYNKIYMDDVYNKIYMDGLHILIDYDGIVFIKVKWVTHFNIAIWVYCCNLTNETPC